MTYVEGEGMAYGIFDEAKDPAVALGFCEVAITRKSARSKWVKMLRLHLRPSADAQLVSGDSGVAMDVFTESILGSIRLQMAHSASTLKVYGRTNEQLGFLQVLVKHLHTQASEDAKKQFKASIEGRFLSIVVK
ncbi:hypothetical protein [Pseudacidovorax sp. NFM-22]|uniref:hypothetical protein n=1 Tax=Pseudacidovorax sp. NFM-22 TaxID=2744469 RepID=UPI001F1AE16D|nr:hypothetical protein [Pseudacidovorax sp. NFM-22]